MHVELDNPYSGFLRQFQRTRVIKRLASVSRAFLQHFTAFEVLNASSASTSRLTTENLSSVMGMLECGSSQQGLPSSLV